MDTQAKSKLFSYSPDELRELYEKESDAFNDLAAEAIREACIGRTAEQTLKLQQMQWTINGHLRKARTPLERMHAMESIFYGQVYGGDGQLSKLITACTGFVRAVAGTAPATSDKQLKPSSKQRLYEFKRISS